MSRKKTKQKHDEVEEVREKPVVVVVLDSETDETTKRKNSKRKREDRLSFEVPTKKIKIENDLNQSAVSDTTDNSSTSSKKLKKKKKNKDQTVSDLDISIANIFNEVETQVAKIRVKREKN